MNRRQKMEVDVFKVIQSCYIILLVETFTCKIIFKLRRQDKVTIKTFNTFTYY